MTLLHIAVLHNNVYATNYLLSLGVIPFIKSINDGKEDETVLDTACRWRYVQIVKILLNNVKWSAAHLSQAKKNSANREIFELIDNHMISLIRKK